MNTTSESVLESHVPHAPFNGRRSSSRTNFTPARRTSTHEPFAAPVAPVVIGKLVGFDSSRTPLVDFPNNESGVALPARSMVVLSERDMGSEIALMFEEGVAQKPVILGRLQPSKAEAGGESVHVRTDGEQITLSAKNEIVLRCGRASITLTRAGKIILRGTYLLGRSSGVNRIKGGSVQIN